VLQNANNANAQASCACAPFLGAVCSPLRRGQSDDMALECSNKTPGPEGNKHVHLRRVFHHASAFTAYLLQPGYRRGDLYD
jgi:hypothetical protein